MTFQPTKYRKAIDDLPIKVYIEGQCFLCGNGLTLGEFYVHSECALAYTDHKDKITKEIMKEYGI